MTQLECTLFSSLVFTALSIGYGSAYAFVSVGLKYYSPGIFQTLRMGIAFLVTLIIAVIRLIFNSNNYRGVFYSHFNVNLSRLVILFCFGFFSLGLPHCLIAVGQKWVSSALVQLTQPISITAGAIFGHYYLPDEPFTMMKLYSLILSLLGVGASTVPTFLHAGGTSNTSYLDVAIGITLVIIGVTIFGIQPCMYKLHVKNADITVSVLFQLFGSFVFAFIWSLCIDGFGNICSAVFNSTTSTLFWPGITGCVGSAFAAHGFFYLVGEIGSFGTNLTSFGQIIVGVITGVLFLGEWDLYTWWEILICLFGMILIVLSMWFGFQTPEINEEEDQTDGSNDYSENYIKEL